MSNESRIIAQELESLGSFYGLDDRFTSLIRGLDLDEYVEIVMAERNLELVIGGVGREDALVQLARSQNVPGEIVHAFQDFAARFPGRMLYTKLCFGPDHSAPSMYFVAIEPWDNILGFLDTMPSIRGSLPALRVALEGSQICFLIGFTLDQGTGSLLVKTYHLFDRRKVAPDPKPFLVSHRLTGGRLAPTTKHYTVNIPWGSLRIGPRWSAITDHARELFGDRYTLMKGQSPGATGADGMKAYLFRRDRRQGESYRIGSYNYYVDEGIRLLQAQRHDHALESFANAVDYAPDDPHTHVRIADCHAATRRYARAIGHALEARRLARAQQGPDATAPSGRPPLSRAHKQTLELLTRELESSPSVRAYLARGSLLFDGERYEEALRDLTRAAELAPTSAEVYNALGGVYLRLGRFGQALEACTHARQLSPRINDSNLKMAEKMAFLAQQLEARPTADLHIQHGELLYHLGLLEAAREAFLEADEWRPTAGVATLATPAPAAAGTRKYLFLPMASPGYVFPSIKLANILQERSQSVLFAVSADYGALLQCQGIDCVRLTNHEERRPFLFPGSWFSSDTVARDVTLLEQVITSYQPDVIVTSPLCLSGFILAERHSIPVVVIGFGEYLFPGSDDDTDAQRNWRITEMARHYNTCRAALSLPPVATSCTDFALLGDQYFIRSIPELDDGLALPARVEYAGGLYWEPSYRNRPLSRFIARSKQERLPLVYVQIGRLFGDRAVWQTLASILGQLPMRFVVDVGRADYVRSPLPDNFYSSSFIPLGAIADDIDHVICAGQSSTVISAILHGKQMLCVPHSSDSREFTAKLVAKGIALTVDDPATGVDPDSLGNRLEELANQRCLDSVLRYQKLFRDHESSDVLFEKMSAVLR